MSGHTKGPWKVSAEVTNRVVDDYATIAHCNVSSRDYVETRANARLIAAAPELLEALKDMLAYTSWDDPCMDMNIPPAIQAARAAIAKAEVSQ